jgi:hypothetical protein
MSSSSNICKLRLTVHDSERFLHRTHGALPFGMWHLILKTLAKEALALEIVWQS